MTSYKPVAVRTAPLAVLRPVRHLAGDKARLNLLALTIALTLGASAARADDDAPSAASEQQPKALEPVTVTASPLAEPGSEPIKASAVISGKELDDQRGSTIGQTVAQIPGVQTSYFGAGVGRPIIRGLEGSRVQVLEGGISALDLSGPGADHAVTINPFLADQVEVLKGPATLLYGTGAIGGVVNVVDGRVPEKSVDGIHGRAEFGGSTVSDERSGMARIDAGNGEFALHADYARRNADDYEIPGSGTLLNSDADSESKAFGVGYTGSSAFAGVSVSQLSSEYGIPVGPSRDPVDPDEEFIRLDIDQTRIDVKAGLIEPASWLEKVTFRLGHNDYQHTEHALGETGGTLFKNKGYEARLEAVHDRIGAWRGAFGAQYGDRDFSVIGDEAIVPATTVKDMGVFVVEQGDLDPFKLELGARYDRRKLEPMTLSHVDFSGSSFSAGGTWEFAEQWHLALNLDRAQRAPDPEELFINGPHDATASFELGDPELDKETANQADLELHYHGVDVQAKIGAYYNRFDNFIYLADTGEVDDEEGLPIRLWSQHDARFHGFEGEAVFKLAEGNSGRWDMRVFGDTVRAELTDGLGDLPRIAPARIGASVMWKRDSWRGSLGAVHYAKQDHLAQFETETDGFTLVNAHLSYGFATGPAEYEVFLDGGNLGDELARNATSQLKDRAPLPGRTLAFGIRGYF